MSSESYPVRWAGRLAVVTAPVEVDLSNAGQLLAELLAVLDREPAVLIVDMSATGFCDSAGMNCIVRAYRRASGQGAELRIAAGTLPVLRVFTLTGLDRLIGIYPSLTASLAAQPPRNPAGSGHASVTGAVPASGPDSAEGPAELAPPAHAGDAAGSDAQ